MHTVHSNIDAHFDPMVVRIIKDKILCMLFTGKSSLFSTRIRAMPMEEKTDKTNSGVVISISQDPENTEKSLCIA